MGTVRELTGHQVVGELRERYADEARAHAATLEAVWETVLCADPDSTDRLSGPDEWSTDEVRAALGLTRAAANRLAGEAHQMFHRLPELGEAMAAGILDPPRARVMADWTTELSDAHAHQVAAEVLPRCRLDDQTRLTTGQLAEEIKLQAIALDPEWARRRYERSIADRKVIASRTPDGTAKLSGTNLPLERVAASVARLDALAKSAKRAGDPRPIDHLRADLFLGMTDGSYRGLTDEQILHALLASRDAKPAATAPAPAPAPAPSATASWAGVDLKVRLTTMLGLDRYPAELAGWGAVHAELARTLVGQLGAAQWRFTFTCPSGHLLRTGLTTARPVGSGRRRASCEGAVEILVPVALLPRLLPHLSADDRAGDCAGDCAGDFAATVPPHLLHLWGPVIHDLHEQLTDPKTQRLLDPRRRAPGAALRRELLASLTRCVHPGCRAPATTADLDHRLDHAKGGRTVGENLNPLCRHDHRVKGEAGWQLRRIGDTFEWTTRLGHVYLVPVPPVLPNLPDQRPSPPEDDLPSDPDHDSLGRPWQASSSWADRQGPPGHRRSRPEPQPERPRPDPDHTLRDPFRIRRHSDPLPPDEPDNPLPF